MVILIADFFFFFLVAAGGYTLSWDVRVKIATDSARGLAFLHTLDKQVIFRDFKASNILLDGVRSYTIMPHKLINYDLIIILKPLRSAKIHSYSETFRANMICPFLLYTELQCKTLGFWHSKVWAFR